MVEFLVRRAQIQDAPRLEALLLEWLEWDPQGERWKSIRRAISNKEILVAEAQSKIVGFIHFVMREDVVDGAPNAFITAFYVKEPFRRKGIGSGLLREAITHSLRLGAKGIETSTIHSDAKRFYERRHFRQTLGDIYEVFLELDVDEFLRTR
jgi:GNAT superfamily N-acetyltransferase